MSEDKEVASVVSTTIAEEAVNTNLGTINKEFCPDDNEERIVDEVEIIPSDKNDQNENNINKSESHYRSERNQVFTRSGRLQITSNR